VKKMLLAATLLGLSSIAAAQPAKPINPTLTYVPLREFAGPTGAVVDLSKGNPRLSFEGKRYTFVPGSKVVYLNAGTIAMAAPAIQMGGTTYVPVRFFTQIGCSVTVPGVGMSFITVACPLANGSTARADLSRR
jgi:hypothetical protein